MIKRFTLQKKVAGVSMAVPIYESEKVTDELIKQVSERVREIEEDSTRIDTHAFALLAALSFAADLRAAQTEHRRRYEGILRTLRKIVEALRSLARDNAPPDR